MADIPRCSIVVPVYNDPACLKRLLASLEQLDGRDEMEVILVDDCSTDDTAAVAEAWVNQDHPFPARLERLPHNSGPGAARNAGLRLAHGECVAFTDSDCIVEPGWMRALCGALDLSRGIAGVGGRVSPVSRRSIFARYNLVNGTLEPNIDAGARLPYLVTCNCAYLRGPLLEAGGFPDKVRVPGGEDVAASIRLFQRGYRFVYEPRAHLHHDFRENFRRFIRTWRNYGYGCAFLTHTMLSRDELNPHCPPAGENDWWVKYVFPTVTGLGTLYLDLRLHLRLARGRGASWWAIATTYPLRPFERFAYYIGWLEGLSAAKVVRPELNEWL